MSYNETLWQSLCPQEYDYVFTVEIQEGAPPLKLPFNVGDDPWLAAHTFLERNELSKQFLDQVAKFITDQAGIGGGEPTLNAGFADPFTGEFLVFRCVTEHLLSTYPSLFV